MSFFRLVLCTVFAACALAEEQNSTKNPNAYAENQTCFSQQNISYMTSLNNTFYVRKRDYNITTQYSCLSARKAGEYGNGSYAYTLSARINGTFVSYNVTSTPKTTGNHSANNSIVYQEFPGTNATDHKLMTTDDNHTCFLFATHLYYGGYGCLLVVIEEIADQDIPPACLTVYEEQCEQGIDPYDASCKNKTSSKSKDSKEASGQNTASCS
uniref:Lipocalin n=1 Tax=Rhipicephalus appendiculatus TaxID=34631 RepID=A0A131Z413_RHIAP